jgi:hypothetical protein
MKNPKSIFVVLLILTLSGGLIWIFWPQEIPATPMKPSPAQVAQKNNPAPDFTATETSKVEFPPPAEPPARSTAAETMQPAPTPSQAERQAGRDARRQMLEKQMQAQLDRIQERINSAENDLVRQGYESQLASTRQSLQQQIDRLAQPPLPPVEMGDVPFTEGAIIRRLLDDGSTLSLNLGASESGQWQLNVGFQYTNANGGTSSSSTSMPTTPGRPMTIDFNDYEIHLTPQVPVGAVPTANWVPPPAPTRRGTVANRLSQ